MIFFGILFIALGVWATVYGNELNSSIREQFLSLINYGSFNPGTVWMIGGVVAIIIGVLFLFGAMFKKR